MTSLRAVVVFILLSASPLAYAVKEVGNGGDAIVCRRGGKITSVRFYDYYEAENVVKLGVPNTGLPGATLDERMTTLFARMERLNPSRAKLYRQWYGEFFQASESEFLTGVELVDIPDTGDGFYPVGCKLEQLVIQRTPRFAAERRYTVNADLYQSLDDHGRAGMILHELILREVRGQTVPHVNSVNARYFNALVSTDQLSQLSLKAYFAYLDLLEFEFGDAQFGVPVLVRGEPALTFLNEDFVQKAEIRQVPFSYAWKGQTLQLEYDQYSAKVSRFLDTGLLPVLQLRLGQKVNVQSKPSVIEWTLTRPATIALYNKTGNARQIRTTGQDAIAVSSSEMVGACRELLLYESGAIWECEIASPVKVHAFGQELQVDSGTIKFDSQGHPKFGGLTINYIELPAFKGRCEKIQFSQGRILTCGVATGQVLLMGQWTAINSSTVDFYPDGSLMNVSGVATSVQSAKLKGTCTAPQASEQWRIGSAIKFHTNGQLAGCRFSGEYYLGGSWKPIDGWVSFYENGNFEHLTVNSGKLSGLDLPQARGYADGLWFYPDGVLKKADRLNGTFLYVEPGGASSWQKVGELGVNPSYIEWTSNGRVSNVRGLFFSTQSINGTCVTATFNVAGHIATCTEPQLQTFVQGKSIEIKGYRSTDWVSFYDSGLVYRFQSYVSSWEVYGQAMPIRGLEIDSSGAIHMVIIFKTVTLPTPSGPKEFYSHNLVEFNLAGQVIASCDAPYSEQCAISWK